MQAILYCDKKTDCIPVQDRPEALLPFCNVPLLTHLLLYMEHSGFQSAVLLAADEHIRRTLDGLRLQMPVRYADSLASLKAQAPTLLLRRLCLPEWDMGELYTLCGKGAVRLLRADGTPAEAELHPTGSPLLEPKETAMLRLSEFHRADTPAEYRALQQQLLKSGKFARQRIGEGVRIGREASIDRMSILGNDCVIGAQAVLEGCVLGDGVQIGAGAVLRDCVICRHALVDKEAHLEGGVVPEGDILPAHGRRTRQRGLLVLPEDGICGGMSRWNTAQTALHAGAAMVSLGMRLVIGYSHPQGESLAMAAAAGAVSQGAHVWQAGACALSQLIYAGRLTDSDALLWASGEEEVQLLPFGKEGMPLTQAQTMRLWRALECGISDRIVENGRYAGASGLLDLWEDACRRLLPDTLPEITVSCADPTLRAAAERLFSGGSGEQITLTLPEDGTELQAFSLEAGVLREEQLLLLSMLSLDGEPLVIPEDFHPAAEAFAEANGCRVLRMHSPEFSPTAAELYARQSLCRDGVRLAVHVLRVLAERHLTLRQAAALLPKLCTVQRDVSTTLTRQAVEGLDNREKEPSVHLSLPPQGRLVRLRVHADTMEAAAELCTQWEKKLRSAEAKN